MIGGLQRAHRHGQDGQVTKAEQVTYAALAERLISLGMISTDTADRVLGFFGDGLVEDEDLLWALEEFEVAVSIDGDKTDDLAAGYRSLLSAATRCTGDAVAVDDVELTFGLDGADILRFTCNGSVVQWSLEHRSGRHLDLMTVWENIDDLDPPNADDHRRFWPIERDESEITDYYVLATDEQALVLANEFDLRLY
ncbi:hypothetical protein ACIBG0_34035 [Nocardia sp. NPDC050630]|uniref:hypothetical protein n=1 Tax=Nocardia sp. NPDC050630 TaxID=3364321 RepID=UPI0037B3B4A2